MAKKKAEAIQLTLPEGEAADMMRANVGRYYVLKRVTRAGGSAVFHLEPVEVVGAAPEQEDRGTNERASAARQVKFLEALKGMGER